MILGVGLEVVNVNGGQARDEQLQLLLVEDGDEVFGDDVIEALQEAVYLDLDGFLHLHVARSLHVLPLVGLCHGDVAAVGDEVLSYSLAKFCHLEHDRLTH